MRYILVGGFKHVLLSIIYGMSSFPLTFIFFRGVAQPPTSCVVNVVKINVRHKLGTRNQPVALGMTEGPEKVFETIQLTCESRELRRCKQCKIDTLEQAYTIPKKNVWLGFLVRFHLRRSLFVCLVRLARAIGGDYACAATWKLCRCRINWKKTWKQKKTYHRKVICSTKPRSIERRQASCSPLPVMVLKPVDPETAGDASLVANFEIGTQHWRRANHQQYRDFMDIYGALCGFIVIFLAIIWSWTHVVMSLEW